MPLSEHMWEHEVHTCSDESIFRQLYLKRSAKFSSLFSQLDGTICITHTPYILNTFRKAHLIPIQSSHRLYPRWCWLRRLAGKCSRQQILSSPHQIQSRRIFPQEILVIYLARNRNNWPAIDDRLHFGSNPFAEASLRWAFTGHYRIFCDVRRTASIQR